MKNKYDSLLNELWPNLLFLCTYLRTQDHIILLCIIMFGKQDYTYLEINIKRPVVGFAAGAGNDSDLA